MPYIDRDVEIRPARAEDREAVLTFCTNTWSWGDYIENVWDKWLNDESGCLFVAVVDGQPAGISHMAMLTKTESWLEGMRVSPEYRGRGLARLLNVAAVTEAMRRGATLVRLIIESSNTRSIHISESNHMRRVAAFTLYTTPILSGEPEKRPPHEHTQLATEDNLDEIIDYLNVSNVFPSAAGLYYIGFKAYSITSELLEEKIAAHGVYLLRRWDRLDGLAIAEVRTDHAGQQLSVGYIDGTAIEAISLIAYDLRRQVAGLEQVRIYAPDLVLVHDVLRGIGYQRDDVLFYVYERTLI